jgi:hypothetical protein
MSETLQERNKALVLEVFDTLFNKRDYEASTPEFSNWPRWSRSMNR